MYPEVSVCFELQKYENEFNEAAALRELYKFIHQYFTAVRPLLSTSNCGPDVCGATCQTASKDLQSGSGNILLLSIFFFLRVSFLSSFHGSFS